MFHILIFRTKTHITLEMPQCYQYVSSSELLKKILDYYYISLFCIVLVLMLILYFYYCITSCPHCMGQQGTY